MSANGASHLLKVLRPADIPKLDLQPVDPAALVQASAIMKDVKEQGVQGLLTHAVKLGDIGKDEEYIMGPAEMKKAYDGLEQGQKDLLQRTHDRIKAFAETQMASVGGAETTIPGGKAGHTISPMAVAGCYAPGGRYPLPSSVLMTAVTAKAAGVKTVVVASPRPAPITIAAAHVAGADQLLRVGGAQSIAALAYGTGSVPACDVIVGPGNKWVTAAKSLVQGRCSIDMLAGPSEVLVIVDGTANADTVAADLLAQAEHDTEARPILVTTDEEKGKEVNASLARQLAELPTKDTAAEAVKKGFIVLCKDIDEAIALSDEIAPEHLEIQTADADAIGKRCLNYGGLFVGSDAAEVLGDYGAGPNHVLPTGGTARYTGGLSVFNFIRIRTWMRIDNAVESQSLVSDAVELARLEGLEGYSCTSLPLEAPTTLLPFMLPTLFLAPC
ncbi:unnamed protein product [Chrysoparadoxa australica]